MILGPHDVCDLTRRVRVLGPRRVSGMGGSGFRQEAFDVLRPRLQAPRVSLLTGGCAGGGDRRPARKFGTSTVRRRTKARKPSPLLGTRVTRRPRGARPRTPGHRVARLEKVGQPGRSTTLAPFPGLTVRHRRESDRVGGVQPRQQDYLHEVLFPLLTQATVSRSPILRSTGSTLSECLAAAAGDRSTESRTSTILAATPCTWPPL